jgi:hypothetical protein
MRLGHYSVLKCLLNMSEYFLCAIYIIMCHNTLKNHRHLIGWL